MPDVSAARTNARSDHGSSMISLPTRSRVVLLSLFVVFPAAPWLGPRRATKPVLHGTQWVAIAGKPLAATAGATIFVQGGNAVDATCAMLAAACTMWDTLGWGGETQALIYNPKTQKVVGVNALGVAPTGATVEFYRKQKMAYPPEYGPLAAVTPGTPGGLLTMLAEFGTMSLAEVLAPAINMAEGYPIEQQCVASIQRHRAHLLKWPYSRRLFFAGGGEGRLRPPAPKAGDIFRQADLAATLRKLIEAERNALDAGRNRKDAIMAAYDRFYRGDIAQEIVRSMKEQGGLFTLKDLDRWRVKLEAPVSTTYRGVEVFKLTHWTQGPALLQALD